MRIQRAGGVSGLVHRQAPRTLCLLLATCLAHPALAQSQTWIDQFGTIADESVRALAPDGAFGVFVGGETSDDLGGPSAGGFNDAWLARYDSAGNRLWIRQFGTSNEESVLAIAEDGAGGAYVGGVTTGDLGGTSAGFEDAWLAHYDSAGNQTWIRQLGTSNSDLVLGAAYTPGGVFVGGQTFGDLGGPNAGGPGLGDAWLARYDSAGNQTWIRQFGSTGDESILCMAPDTGGGAFIGGGTFGDLGGPNAGPSFSDAWLARYDSTGNQAWIRQFGTTSDESVLCMTASGTAGVYVGGGTYGDLGGPNASPGFSDAWVARYDFAGNQSWIRQFGTIADESVLAVARGAGGTFHIGGSTSGDLGGPNTALGFSDAWVANYDGVLGNRIWIRQFGTTADDFLHGAASDQTGGVFLGGNTFGDLGGPNAGFGFTDAWVARREPACAVASAFPRNNGSNPQSLTASVPILGGNFTATVDLSTTGHANALLFAFDGAVDTALPGGQRLLCANVFGNGKLYQSLQPGPLASFSFPIPNSLSLCGRSLCMQAAHLGSVAPFALSNAQDLVLGY